ANDSIIAGWVLDVRGLLDERGSGMELIRARVDAGPWYYGTWDVRGRYNITLSSTTDGYHTIEVNAVDKVGNVGQTFLYRVLTDGTPPFIEIVSPGNYARTTPVLLVGRTEQGASVSINSVPVEVDMTGSFELLLELPEGLASFLIEAVDVAGNTNSTTHSLEVDLTPPLFSIDAPSDGEWLGESPFQVSGSTEEGATVLINGEEAFRDGSSFNRSVDYGEGVHTLLVLVRDKAGNEVTTQLTVGVDLTPPEIIIDVPVEYESLTSTSPFGLSGVVLDENEARVFVNGVEAELTDGHWTSEVELERGYQVIDVKAEDVAGHQTFASRRVYYDPDRPRLTVVLILGEEELVDLQGTIRTTETSAILRLGLDEDALILLGASDPIEGSRGVNIVELFLVENDVTQVVVDARDMVGNLAGEVSFIIEVDDLPPVLVVTEPLNGSVSRSQEVTIRGTCEPGASVRVDGIVVPLDATGAFEVNVTLEEGPNEIEITAEDDLGNSVVKTLAVDHKKEGPADPGGGLAYLYVALVVIVITVVAVVLWKRR
nr:hypothetical protein [Thermoplasmata archaeon]NIS11565.1 hypothetical protein [Thermoplasmata archaeon]NIS20863.1 hypothetical protein [Thermoplasmata archaeon]NIT78284.1 hypothetical protein [Thermoplasmata archaeon]NIU48599.1 hypothetical protein [Thermoplasmata archaeon]